jgi:SAM-dependent methyltransferase
MYSGFPIGQIPLLRCPAEGGPIDLPSVDGSVVAGGRLVTGELRCRKCHRTYQVVDGIVQFLDEDALNPESAHERRLRDERIDQEDALATATSRTNDDEMRPTLDALRQKKNGVLLELGCGTGRYTIALIGAAQTLLAVDFSRHALLRLAQHVPDSAPLGLLHADISRLFLTPGQFDGCLSTLVSNLPSSVQRQAMFRLAAEALRDDGVFVFSTHHYSIRDRLDRVSQAGRYGEGGIYRYYLRKREIVNECTAFFHRIRARPIQVSLPIVSRLPWLAERVSGSLGWLPVLRDFGRLLLVEASRPVRHPAQSRGC